MLRLLLTKYWVLVHLIAVAGILCFIPEPSMGLGVWLAGSLLAMMLYLPPVLKGESFWLARVRVATALKRDVVCWAGLLAAAYVAVALFNGPRTAVYEAELRRWIFTAPPLPLLPSSITPEHGAPFFAGLLGGLVGALAVRCALPRGQRLIALVGIGALTGVFMLGCAVVACVQGQLPEVSWLGGGVGVGALAVLMFCVCFGTACETFLEGHWRTFTWALVAACANALGVIAVAPISFIGIAVVAVLFLLGVAVVAIRGGGRYPHMLWYLALVGAPLFALAIGLGLRPGSAALLSASGEWGEMCGAFWEQWVFRAGLAFKALGAEPMLGLGPDGFSQAGQFFVKGRHAWALWKAGGTALPCDLFLLLAERGMLGALLLLLPGAAMLGRCLMRWVEFRQSVRKHYSMRYLFVLIGSLVGVVSVLVMSFLGAPLHVPAVLGVFLIVCACMGGWMPRPR